MVNKIILIGHIGKDPEQPRETKTGLKVLDLSLATKKRSKDDGVDWHAITCFGKTAEIAHKYLSKGMQVYIEGRLNQLQEQKLPLHHMTMITYHFNKDRKCQLFRL